MFRRLKKNARSSQSENSEAERIIAFCDEVLDIYKKYGFESKD
jgi:hypothetical protein